MNDQLISDLTEKIAQSKKYKGLYRPTIERVVKESLERYGSKEVEVKARNILHQAWGAYWETRPNFRKLLDRFQEEIKNGKDIKEAVLSILSLQSSTKERLPVLGDFYQKIFDVTGLPNSINELACGLNPLTYFWMDLSKTITYKAYDIDVDEVTFLNNIIKFLGSENQIAVFPGDILVDDFDYADIVLMLKLLPCLEHQKRNSGLKVLKHQNCKFLVVSYPIKSIKGIEKGMAEFYTQQFEELIKNEGWSYQRILFETELVFVVKKE